MSPLQKPLNMTAILSLFYWIVTCFLLVQVAYLAFFSLAATLRRKQAIAPAAGHLRLRIFIPGYKEDAVIIATAKSALEQDYPKARFEVVVIADSFAPATLEALRRLPVKLVEVSFEKSTKGKALQKAVETTEADPVDAVVILDADNIMAPGFLQRINEALVNGYDAVQGHRTAKNHETAFAFLDACTEEINNHIFRRGHVAVGLPSALIGSGMAFRWPLFVSLLQNIGDTSGEDKELEFRLMRLKKKIAFLDGAYVYDEKVAHNQVFTRQRSRWLAMQLEFFAKYFLEGWQQLFRGNLAFFNKVFQTYLLPRVFLVAAVGLWTLFCFLLAPSLVILCLSMTAALALALLLGIPLAWYNRRLLAAFLQIPGALLAIVQSALQMGQARKQFIHTPHGEKPA